MKTKHRLLLEQSMETMQRERCVFVLSSQKKIKAVNRTKLNRSLGGLTRIQDFQSQPLPIINKDLSKMRAKYIICLIIFFAVGLVDDHCWMQTDT